MSWISIRPYQASDLTELNRWWVESGGRACTSDEVPEACTYLACIDSVPALSVSLYPTPAPAYTYLDLFVGNPALSGSARRALTVRLLQHVEQEALKLGCTRIMCMSAVPELKEYYQTLGFVPVLENITVLAKGAV